MLRLRISSPATGIALVVAALTPAMANADAVSLGLKGNRLDVAMTADGAAHVARLLPGTPKPVLAVCRIPAGGTVCTQTASVPLPRDYATGPFVVASGTRVTVAAGNADGAAEGTYAMTAPTGTSYGAPKEVAHVTATDVELSPAGNRLWISAARGTDGSANDFAAFVSAPLPPGFTNGAVILGSASGSQSLRGQLVGVRPDGRPLTLLSGSAPGLVTGNSFYAFQAPTAADATLGLKANWSAATPFDLPAPAVQNGEYEVASAPGRMWLAYEGLGTDVLLRRWEDGGLGPALSPDCWRPSRFAAGSQQAPALAISRTGDLQLAYVGSDTTDKHLVYLRGTPDGSAFSAYQELYTGPGDQADVEIASDPTSDTGGIVVWTTNGVYADKGELKFARLPEAPIATCTQPPTEGPAQPVATPVPTVTPTPTPKPVKPKLPSLTTVVQGLPATKRCNSRRAFTIRLRHPKGTQIGSATVKVNGKTVATRKGKRVTAPVDLRGLPKGTYTVTIKVKLADGRTIGGSRRYRTCAPGKRR